MIHMTVFVDALNLCLYIDTVYMYICNAYKLSITS